MECTRAHKATARSIVLLVCAMVVTGASTPLAARAIFKCTLADGKTVFSDTPCKETTSQQQLQMRGGTTQEVGPSPEAEAAKATAAKQAEAGGCYTWMPPTTDVVVKQPDKTDPELLPHDAADNPIEIFVGKRTPTTLAAACSAMVSACTQKSDDPRSMMDACFKSAPRCTTNRPWEEEQVCCPQACWDKYVDLRRHCVDPSGASYKALFAEHCVTATP